MQGAVEDGEVISRGDEGPQVEGDVAKHLEDTVVMQAQPVAGMCC
jgi:hypothetical protein